MAPYLTLPQLLYTIKDSLSDEQKQAEQFKFFQFCINNVHLSKSQCFQDLWVMYEMMENSDWWIDRPAFYFEFGACDGLESSNTYVLQKTYGWDGLLAEPNPVWHEALQKNRNDCGKAPIISYDAIGPETGEVLSFLCTDHATLGGFEKYMDSDYNKARREEGPSTTIEMTTRTIYDVFDDFVEQEPFMIDYLSIDTEGSEYVILKSFFDDPRHNEYQINMITVEHNFHPTNRQAIQKLLEDHGYVNKFREFSRWDDFYIKKDFT